MASLLPGLTARAAGLAPVLGVELGAPRGELEAASRRAGLSCRLFPGQGGEGALGCIGGLGAAPFPLVSSYELRGGRVARIEQRVQRRFPFYSHYVWAWQLWRNHIESRLGQGAGLAEDPLPPWAQSLDDGERRRALGEGRLRAQVRWPQADGTLLTLTLRGEAGQPVIVLVAERPAAAAPGALATIPAAGRPGAAVSGACSADELLAALGALFPPTEPARRVESARTLARCRDQRTLAPLRSALAHDEEATVRIESVRALALAGDREPAVAVLGDPDAEDVLRAAALDALSSADAAPGDEELATLTQQPGPRLQVSLSSLREKRTTPVPAVPQLSPGNAVAAAPPPPAPGAPAATAPAPTRAPGPLALALPPRPPIMIEAKPPEPARPWVDRDGTALAITTSIAAGGLWGGGLALLAQQNGVGVVTLLGSAGAVIGGGTAWGLTRFGLRPNAAQALWFANSTAWGALAGLTAWSGSGSDNPKLKYGLLVGGETLGILAGAWSASRFDFRPGETLFADSLVLGAGLGVVGTSMLLDPDGPWDVPAAAAIGVVPTLVGAAVLSKLSNISRADVPLLTLSPIASAWTGALLASGFQESTLLDDATSAGGALLGAGAGYLAAAAAASFVEPTRKELAYGSAGLLAGNGLGLGVHMLADPGGRARWPLGTALGGVALATAGYAAAPYLRPGPSAFGMTMAGALYGSGLWTVALRAASTGQPADARVPGGMLAGGVAAGLGGFVASQYFAPQAYHQGVALLGTALGIGAGLGTAKLTTADKGLPELVGVLAGGAAGFTGGAIVSTGARLRPPAILAGAAGGSYGLLVGSLLPTLADERYQDGRKTAGAGWLGLSLGAAGATLGARALDAGGGQVALVTGAGVLGLGMGAGAGWLWPVDHTRPARIGLVAGSTAMLAAGALAERTLRLSEFLGPHSVGLALFGAGLGATHGALAGRVVEPDTQARWAGQQLGGAVLLGTSAGLASGLLASRWIDPTTNDYLGVAGASVLGHSAGLGLARLVLDPPPDRPPTELTLGPPDPQRGERVLRLLGAAAGMGGGALVATLAPLRTPDLLAGLVGTGYGALLGSLAPSLHRTAFDGGRRAQGGAHLGLALGGVAAATAAHLTDATQAQILLPTVAAGLGGLGGFGLGQMLAPPTVLEWLPGEIPPIPSTRGQRLGAFAGILGLGAASIALDRPLRLSEGFAVPGAGSLTVLGGALGIAEGILLAGLVDPSGIPARTDGANLRGGALLGVVAGGSTGYVLARFIQPTAADQAAAVAGGGLGAGLGLGVSMLATDATGRPDTAGALAGSLAGLGAAAATQRFSPLQPTDVLAAPVGLAFGGLFGRLAPTLGDARIGELHRRAGGGLLAGLTGGALGAVALRHATDARPTTVGLAALGGVDGALSGLGLGLLLDDCTRDLGRLDCNSQAQRIGVVAGGLAGLGLGAGLWPRLDLRGTDGAFIATLSALGAWNGLLAPALGHADGETVNDRFVAGGALAGIGAGSLLATALVPALELDADLLTNAVALDLLLTGAGAGVGALISARHDAPVWGAMGGGAAGLLLGAGLHRAIAIDDRKQPLLMLSAFEGLWLGGWLPYALRPTDQVTGRQQVGALAAGVLGGAALATLASPVFQPDGHTATTAAFGSAIGAALAGGSALIADPLHGRAGVGLMLGGTGAGLLLGGLGASSLDLRAGAGYAALGSLLGASEGLVFAWSGRSDGGADYGGAALVGAGLGSTMGLVAAANPRWLQGRGLPAAGFGGWGAWMGSFAGALINRDPHEVTLGGLAGANLGVLGGMGVLASGLVEPRDFGWLSAFGAAGTVVGGGVGALFATRTDPRPALAGLLIGPAVGLASGALVLPQLRRFTPQAGGPAWGPRFGRSAAVATTTTRQPDRASEGRPTAAATTPAASTARATDAPTDATSADLWEAKRAGRAVNIDGPLPSRIRRSFRISHLMPVLGAMPSTDPTAGPPPFVLGVSGLWR